MLSLESSPREVQPPPLSRIIAAFRPLYTLRGFRVLFLLNVLLGFAYSFVAPFMSMFGTIEVGMSKVRFGLFMTLMATAGIVIGTTLARYSDTHFSRRSMLLWGSVSGLAGYVGFAYCRSFEGLLFIGTFVLGVSSISFSQLFAHARELLAATDIAPSQRVFYMNVFRMFFALSWTVGPMIAAWVMLHYSYRGLFLCAAGNFALFGLAVAAFVPSAPPPFARHASKSAQSLLKILTRLDLLAHLAAMVLVFAAATMNMVNLPLCILETLKGTQADVGVTYSVAPVFELPFMLYFGWLAIRSDAAGIVRSGMAIATVYFLLLLCVTHPWQIWLCQILSAAMTAVISGIAITYFQGHLPHHPGTATNLYANAQRVGSTGGYFLYGFIAQHLGYRFVFGVCAAFALLGFFLMFVPVRVETPESEALLGPDLESDLA
jgi:MFS transporter, SET family, sugar efflux transporter